MPTGVLQTHEAGRYIANNIGIDDWRNQSGASILSTLRTSGIAIRTQDFYDIRREAMGLYKHQEQIEKLLPATPIPRAWVTTTTKMDLSRKYLYRIKVTGTDPDDGSKIDNFFAVASDEELLPQSAVDQIVSSIIGAEDFYGIEAETYQLYQVIKRE